MKKIIALFLSILMIVSFVIPVNSAYEVTYGDTTVIYSLTSEGKNTVYVQPGDEITVNFYVINKTKPDAAFTVESIYNDIKINNDFFEIDITKIESPIGLAYAHFQNDTWKNKWARFNGEHSQEPGGLRTYSDDDIVGTFKLTVKATEGQTTLESTDPWMTDNGNIAYHIECKNLTVIIGNEPVTLYTVTYMSEGTQVLPDQNASGTITVADAPDNGPENHQFMGWENNGTLYQPGDSFVLTGNTVFTAEWKRIVPSYTLTFDTKGGTTYNSLTLEEGSVVDLTTYIPTKTGYTFEGWYTEPEYTTNKVTSVTLDSNKTVYAQWKPEDSGGGGGGGGASVIKYTITFKNTDNTDIKKVKYDANTTVDLSLHKPEKDGFDFEGWYTDKELKNKVTSIKLTKDTVLYANWSNKDESSVKPDYKPSILTDEHYAYIVGREGGMIAPESDITRAEVATIIYRLLEEDERNKAKTKENVFTDVNEDDWFNTAVSTLASLELVNGRTADTFAPNAFITRAELATIFARMVEVEYDGKVLFDDVSGHWAESYIAEAATAEWIVGYNGLFRPDDNITRAEVMTLVNRVLNREPESKADLLDGMTTWKDNADENAWYYLAVQEATNSHTYDMKADGKHEKWTSLTENPDWSKIED